MPDIDVFLANQGQQNQVLLNDGSGTFTLAPNQPEGGALRSFAVAPWAISMATATSTPSSPTLHLNPIKSCS